MSCDSVSVGRVGGEISRDLESQSLETAHGDFMFSRLYITKLCLEGYTVAGGDTHSMMIRGGESLSDSELGGYIVGLWSWTGTQSCGVSFDADWDLYGDCYYQFVMGGMRKANDVYESDQVKTGGSMSASMICVRQHSSVIYVEVEEGDLSGGTKGSLGRVYLGGTHSIGCSGGDLRSSDSGWTEVVGLEYSAVRERGVDTHTSFLEGVKLVRMDLYVGESGERAETTSAQSNCSEYQLSYMEDSRVCGTLRGDSYSAIHRSRWNMLDTLVTIGGRASGVLDGDTSDRVERHIRLTVSAEPEDSAYIGKRMYDTGVRDTTHRGCTTAEWMDALE
ncbi:hypothetical protein Tco_0640066 [Tanacetum coccineum]